MLLRVVFRSRPAIPQVATVAAILVFVGACLPAARSQESLSDSISNSVGKVFEERRGAVVKVLAYDDFGLRLGSGFFADPTGTIYTHAAIVLKAGRVVVVQGGRELPARVLAVDERSGVALLKVDASGPFIPAGDSREAKIATPVMTIGFAEDFAVSPSFGIISGIDRRHLGQYFATTHLRASMPVQRGQGGAPVLNMKGEAIGILVARIEGAACHILPIRAAEKVRRDQARFGELRPGWVGVEVEDDKEASGGSTARVLGLDPSTPAALGGLRAGDILLGVGDVPIATSEDVIDASFFLTAGNVTPIDILRNGEKITLKVNPTLHPLAPARDVHAVAPDSIQWIRLE